MANITVSASNPVVSVASTLSNVAVSDVDSGQLVTTISTSQSNVSVSSTSTEVTVGGLAAVSNAVIRSAVSAQDLGGDGSFSYNPTTGVFTYTGPDPLEVRAHFSNTSPITYNSSQGIFGIDSGALFSGKTTDDLPEGNNNIYFSKTGAAVNTNNLPQGSLNKYFTTTGAAVNTDNLAEGTTNFFFTNSRFDTRFATKTTSNLTEGSNLYFTNTRARNAVSFIPGSGAYTPATGVFQIPTNTSHVLENTNLYYTNARVLAYIIDNGLDFNAEKVDDQVANLLVAGNSIDITYNDSANTLTIDYQEDVVSNGNIFGNVSFDLDSGTIHKASLISNITGMSFANITAGDSATLIFTQDLTGYRIIDTTTYPANWTNWDFTDNSTELSLDPSAVDVMSVVYDGTTYYASIVSMEDSAIPNSNLSNSNVIINGTTFTLGTSGTLNTFNTDVVINGNLEVAGNIDYVNVEDLLVNDQSITLNYGNASARDAFVYVDRSGSALNNAHIKWNETSDQWEIYDGTSTYKIPVSTDDLAEGSTNKYYATSLFNTDFATKTTDDLTEGSTNLYFSNTNLATSSTTHLPEGTNLYYTDARVDTHLNTGTATTGEVLSWTGSDYDWVAQTGGTSYSNANVADYLLDTGIQKKAHTVFVQDLALSPDAANAQLGFYFPNGSGSAGQVLKFFSSTQLTQEFLDTGNVTETTNLYYTDARANSAIDAYVTGGNAISVSSGVVSLDNTAVTPKTYGDATNVAQITVDQQGRITGVSNVAISGGGTYGNADVQNFLENGYSTANIIADNITANIITATTEFLGDLDGAISVGVFNNTASTLTKGQAVYITGAQGDEACVALANNQIAASMPAMGIIKENIGAGASGQAVTSGTMNFAGHGFTVGADLYVNGAGLLTETIPTGEGELIQKIAKALAPNFTLVQGAGRTNATPSLNFGNIFLGNASNESVTAVFTDEANSAIEAHTGNIANLTGLLATTGNLDLNSGTAVDNLYGLKWDSSVNKFISSPDAGTKAPDYFITIEKEGTDLEAIRGRIARSGAFGWQEKYEKAEGTLASPTALGNDDEIWRFDYLGHDGTDYGGSGNKSSLTMRVFQDDETSGVSTGIVPLTYEIAGQLDGNLTPFPTSFMSIHSDGKIVFNDAGTRQFNTKTGTANISRDGTIISATDIIARGNVEGTYFIGDVVGDLTGNLSATTTTAVNIDATGTISAASMTPDDITLKSFQETVVSLGTTNGDLSSTIDGNNGSIFTVTANGGITINTIANASTGSSYTIKITQDGTGSRLLTSSMKFQGGDKILSTGAGNVDVMSVVYDGTDYLATLTKDYK